MNRRAFTLIEILVCITIVMILGGIAYAAMGPSRESARQRVCVSNLKQVSSALTMYTNDYDGIEPTIGVASKDVELGLPPVQSLGYFVRDYVHNSSVMRCPNYRPVPGAERTISYWWNGGEHNQMPETARFSQIVKRRGVDTPLMGCEEHHPDFDLSIEPRWTLQKVIFLRLSGAVEVRMKPVREKSPTW
jgi:prepilin-type N-terminal cleavage/methylation domain-containing protein